MASPSINDQIDRVRAIMALYSGIGTDVTLGADLATTPGFEVFTRRGDWQPIETKRSLITRTLVIRVYAVENNDPSDDVKMRVAIRAANAFVVSMGQHIRQKPGLMLPGADAGFIVGNVGPIADLGPFPLSYKNHDYAGFELEFTVTTTG